MTLQDSSQSQECTKPTIGSLCTGYGGLDLAVEAHFNAETIWCAEFDKYASQVIEQRFGIPNHKDIKSIDWSSLEPIDILTAGYPCQPFSHAGERKGTEDARHLFPYIAKAISVLRPRIVVLENVRGHLSLGLKEVLACLADLGYDARWQIVRASDVGAPHRRERIFIVAHTNSNGGEESRRAARSVRSASSEILNWTDREIDWSSGQDAAIEPSNTDGKRFPLGQDRSNEIRNQGQPQSEFSGMGEVVSHSNDQHISHNGQVSQLGRRFTPRREMYLQSPPDALDSEGKLSALFVEYMMGLPKGWVTDTGLSRAQQLKMLGNGVVPQQAEYALELLTTRILTSTFTNRLDAYGTL